jgi:DNA-directed RNA polymerase specialized sigma24 family protein
LSYERIKPKASLRSYLIRYGAFGLRDWLWEQQKSPDREPYNPNKSYREDREPNLLWLFDSSRDDLTWALSSYERYLLYLYYGQGLTTREITLLLNTYRKKVQDKLNKALFKLRRAFNETKHSRGYRKGSKRIRS